MKTHNIHTENFFRLVHWVNEKINDFQETNDFLIDIQPILSDIKDEINRLKIDKAFIYFDEILDPEFYGWTSEIELPPLDWISAVIAGHFINHKLNPKLLNKLLSAIIYLGFYGLFELFDNIDGTEMSLEEQFNYYRLMAKYNKEQGEFENSQDFYRKTIDVAKKVNRLPYAFVLLSKFYSDYLQRNGMCIAYSQIAYERMINNENDINRTYFICLDTYAKEIRGKNREKSDSIYCELLSKEQDIPFLSFQRIKFRYIEMKIEDSIKEKKINELSFQLKEFEKKIEEIYKNPKASYIRKIIFVKLMRKVVEEINQSEYDEWLKNKVSIMREYEAILTLNNCIEEANKYRDRKNISIAYYEKSFWSNEDTEEQQNYKSIFYLNDGLSYTNVDNQKSIINRIYTKLLFRLAEIYVKLNNWEESIKCYYKLYDYISFLISELEKDKNILDIDSKNQELAEFVNLNENDLLSVELSLLTDYEELTKMLIDINRNITNIQTLQMANSAEILETLKELIKHDFSGAINLIKANIKKIEGENVDVLLSDAKAGLKKVDHLIDDTIKSTFEKLINPNELPDLNIIIETFIKRYSFYNNIDIKYEKGNKIKAKVPVEFVRRLIDNLIENSREVGIRNNLKKIQISIRCEECSDTIYLLYTDNTQDFDAFMNVIKLLNLDAISIPSKKNSSREGTGLISLKKLFGKYNKNTPWELKGNDSEKTLTIPLSCYKI